MRVVGKLPGMSYRQDSIKQISPPPFTNKEELGGAGISKNSSSDPSSRPSAPLLLKEGDQAKHRNLTMFLPLLEASITSRDHCLSYCQRVAKSRATWSSAVSHSQYKADRHTCTMSINICFHLSDHG